MTKKHFCDRCEKEIKVDGEEKDFQEFFKSAYQSNDLELHEPELCKKCQKGYYKIIKETNKEIYLFITQKLK